MLGVQSHDFSSDLTAARAIDVRLLFLDADRAHLCDRYAQPHEHKKRSVANTICPCSVETTECFAITVRYRLPFAA